MILVLHHFSYRAERFVKVQFCDFTILWDSDAEEFVTFAVFAFACFEKSR